MKLRQAFSTFVVASAPLLVAGGACAAPFVPSACTFGNTVTLENMWVSGTNNYVFSGAGIQATSCYGVTSGNNVASEPSGSDNLGVIDTSVLNGGSVGPNTYFDPYYLPGVQNDSEVHFNSLYSAFATGSALVDMDQDGQVDDPGWIYLGKNGTSYGELNTGTAKLALADYLDIVVTGMGGSSGTWKLDLDPSIIAAAQSILGPNVFDHLALLVKAGDFFAIYDFDFTILEQYLPPGAFNFTTAYSFSGNWSTHDINDKDISNLVLWARDPVTSDTSVPEPGSLALFGIGLAGWGMMRRRLG